MFGKQTVVNFLNITQSLSNQDPQRETFQSCIKRLCYSFLSLQPLQGLKKNHPTLNNSKQSNAKERLHPLSHLWEWILKCILMIGSRCCIDLPSGTSGQKNNSSNWQACKGRWSRLQTSLEDWNAHSEWNKDMTVYICHWKPVRRSYTVNYRKDYATIS